MGAFDEVAGVVSLPPLWATGALLGLLAVLCAAVFRRSGFLAAAGVLIGIPAAAAVAVWAAAALVEHSAAGERAAERRALEARSLELTTRAIAPGSPLACLEAQAGEAVEVACEQTLFATPEMVAAAVAFVNARLLLLADFDAYASAGSYEARLAGLRRSLETDRFGLVAHVLASRDDCTANQCRALALLRDPETVKHNLQSRKYEELVARYSSGWGGQRDDVASATAASVAPVAPPLTLLPVPTGAAVTKPIDFPSAASIPPVSIMNDPPASNASAEAAPPRAATPPATPRRAANGNPAPAASAPAPAVTNPTRAQ